MCGDEHAERGAEAEEGEPILGSGMIGIVQQDCMFIGEDRLGPRERDIMLSDVVPGLRGIPLEAKVVHAMICTPYIQRKVRTPLCDSRLSDDRLGVLAPPAIALAFRVDLPTPVRTAAFLGAAMLGLLRFVSQWFKPLGGGLTLKLSCKGII